MLLGVALLGTLRLSNADGPVGGAREQTDRVRGPELLRNHDRGLAGASALLAPSIFLEPMCGVYAPVDVTQHRAFDPLDVLELALFYWRLLEPLRARVFKTTSSSISSDRG